MHVKGGVAPPPLARTRSGRKAYPRAGDITIRRSDRTSEVVSASEFKRRVDGPTPGPGATAGELGRRLQQLETRAGRSEDVRRLIEIARELRDVCRRLSYNDQAVNAVVRRSFSRRQLALMELEEAIRAARQAGPSKQVAKHHRIVRSLAEVAGLSDAETERMLRRLARGPVDPSSR